MGPWMGPDGQSFYAAAFLKRPMEAPDVNLVLNRVEELKARAPAVK